MGREHAGPGAWPSCSDAAIPSSGRSWCVVAFDNILDRKRPRSNINVGWQQEWGSGAADKRGERRANGRPAFSAKPLYH